MSNSSSPAMPVTIVGPAGQLEGLWTPQSTTVAATSHCALLCHPHPQYGGSMHDSVLAIAAEVLSAQGFSHLRFNFRGVGGSAGSYDNGNGEGDDIVAAWHWLQERSPHPEPSPRNTRLLIGYSFGAAIAWRVKEQCSLLNNLVLIAPPTQSMGFAGDAGPVPAQVIVGDNDSYCDLNALPAGAAAQIIPGADHFFSTSSQALGDGIAGVLP